MENHHQHTAKKAQQPDKEQTNPKAATRNSSYFSLAISATFHCLIGCSIGEILGMVISTAAGLNNYYSILISILLGFTGGLLLGILPLMKHGFSLTTALKTVIIGEGLSIFVMEMFEVLIAVSIPGVMDAHLTDGLFWTGMAASIPAGFLAALPVNYFMIKRGIRHIH